MTDRRSFLKAAALGVAATGVGIAAPGCAAPTDATAAPVTIPAADVPVGGGRILEEARYVVTQPTAGVYKAFTKTCTHQGCPVSGIDGDDIVCRCHGARFSIADGSVTNGPAQRPLAEADVTVEGADLKITPRR